MNFFTRKMVKHVFWYITVVNSYYYLPLKLKKKKKIAVGRRYKRNYLLMIVTHIVVPIHAQVCLLSLYSHRFPYVKDILKNQFLYLR